MARGFEYEIVVLARHDATGIELARRQPVAHHFEQRLAAGGGGGLGHFMASNHFLSGSSRTTLAGGFSSISAASICWKRCEIFRLETCTSSASWCAWRMWSASFFMRSRSEEHTSELQSLAYLVCRLLLEKKKHFGRVLGFLDRYGSHQH